MATHTELHTKFTVGETVYLLSNERIVGGVVNRFGVTVLENADSTQISRIEVAYCLRVLDGDVDDSTPPWLNDVPEGKLFGSPEELTNNLLTHYSRP